MKIIGISSILWNWVPDQIESFIFSDTEPDATEFSDTLDVVDNAYKNVEY